MKRIFQFILVITIISCQGNKKSSEKESETENDSKVQHQVHTRNFVTLGKNNITQELSLQWTDEKKVTYVLKFKNDSCEMELEGMATSKAEGDNNEDLTFSDKKETLTVIIQLKTIDRDRSIVTLKHKDSTNTCNTDDHLMFETATE